MKQPPLVSVCVLSYNRPDFLAECLESVRNAGMPVELLVGDDGSGDPDVRRGLVAQLEAGLISGLVLMPPNHNEGVGRMVNRLFGIASGDYLVKCDQDCVFKPGALATMVGVMEHNRKRALRAEEPFIGSLGGFRYDHDPVNHEDMHVCWRGPWEEVRDYVSSVMMLTRRTWATYGPWEQHSSAFAEDVAFKRHLKHCGLVSALTRDDVIVNERFGIGPSTVVPRPGQVAEIHAGPVVVS